MENVIIYNGKAIDLSLKISKKQVDLSASVSYTNSSMSADTESFSISIGKESDRVMSSCKSHLYTVQL